MLLESFELWLLVCFFNRAFFLSKNIGIISNLNYYGICKEGKEKFEKIADIKFRKSSRFRCGSIQ